MTAATPQTEAPIADAQRVLIVRLGAIGDCLRVLPAVRRLRLARPDLVIGWAVEHWVYPLLAGNPNVDRFHVLGRARLRSGVIGAATEIARFARELRAERYDTALDFHARFKSGLVTRVSGAAHRIGYAAPHTTEGNHLFTNRHVSLPPDPENRVTRFLRLLGPLGVDPVFDPHDAGIHVDPELRRRALAWYDTHGRPPLAVYAGTSLTQARYHRWPASQWVDLLQRLGREGVRSVVLWGPDDADYSRTIAAQAGPSCTLAPATTLTELLALVGCFRGFIGANTAAMHMAWLQGIPTAVFTGPADPRVDAPLPPVPSRVLRADDKVRPGVSKRHQADVVAAVTVDDALAAARAILAAAVD